VVGGTVLPARAGADSVRMTHRPAPPERRHQGDFRVFYDVDEERSEVIVRAIRRKGTMSTEEIL
jgi:mRNA-degrading endonuclease RelE of RelBE toxin-antitoxin system